MEKPILVLGITMIFFADGVCLTMNNDVHKGNGNGEDRYDSRVYDNEPPQFQSYGVLRELLRKTSEKGLPVILVLSLHHRLVVKRSDDHSRVTTTTTMSDDDMNKALECIDLCSQSLTQISVHGSDSLSEKATNVLMRRACCHHPNNVHTIHLDRLYVMSFSKFVQVLSSNYCRAKNIILSYYSFFNNGTWTPQCFRNLDYSKLHSIVFHTDDGAAARELLSALKDSPPSQLTSLSCHHVCQDNLGLLAETIQHQSHLKSLWFQPTDTTNNDHVMELLERILSPLDAALKRLYLAPKGSLGRPMTGLKQSMTSEQWHERLIPLLQKNTTLLHFFQPDFELPSLYNGECEVLNGVLERNRILAKLKTVDRKVVPNVVPTAPVKPSGKGAQRHHTLAKTIYKLASIPNAEPTALYYYLQQSSDHLISLKFSGDGDNNEGNNNKKKKVGPKHRKRKSAPSRGVTVARKKQSGRRAKK